MNVVELEFLNGLLNLDPKKRFDGRVCLSHPYLRELTENDRSVQHLLETTTRWYHKSDPMHLD